MTLDDGAEYEGVHVAWATEVVGVEGHEEIPLDVSRIVEVRQDPPADVQLEDDAPF